MAHECQFPYSKIIREDGEVIPASDHNKQEHQLECLTDALGEYNFALGTVEERLGAVSTSIINIQGDIINIEGDITNIEGDITTITTNITNIEGDITTIEGDVTTINNTITTIEGDITTIDNRVTIIENTVINLDDLGDVEVIDPQDGDSLVFVEGAGTDASGGTSGGMWRPLNIQVAVASGLPGSTDESVVESVREIRFISNSGVGEDHEVVQIANGVAYIGAGAPPGNLSTLTGLTGLVTGRLSGDPATTDPTIYPTSVFAGDLYDSITQNSTWLFDTDASEFGNANLGNLILRINGVDVANIDLAANFVEANRDTGQDIAGDYNITGTGDPVISGVVSFVGGTLEILSVSPFGSIPVDSYQQGVAQINLTASALQKGFNRLTLRHVTALGTNVAVLEWFYDVDPAGLATDPAVTSIDINENTLVPKFLSGVSYYDALSTFDVDVDGLRLFNNVYHDSEEPLTVAANWISGTPAVINIADGSVSGLSSPPEIGETMTVSGFVVSVAPTFTITDATAVITPRDPYGSYTTGTTPSKDFAIMSVASSSSDTADFFTDEEYRLPNTTNFDTPIAGMPGPPLLWDSTISLTAGARAGELQVYDHTEASNKTRLQYPVFDYTTGFLPLNPGNDYSALPAGTRTYYRVFRSTTGAKTNGIITFPGIAEADLGNIGLRIKVPSKTVWLDLTASFNGGTFPTGAPLSGGTDGEGCRINAGVNSLDINGQIEFSLGSIGTDISSDFQIILEITYTNSGVTEITGAGSGLSINW